MTVRIRSYGSEGSRGLADVVLQHPLELLLMWQGTIPYLPWMNSRQERDRAQVLGSGLSLFIEDELSYHATWEAGATLDGP